MKHYYDLIPPSCWNSIFISVSVILPKSEDKFLNLNKAKWGNYASFSHHVNF